MLLRRGVDDSLQLKLIGAIGDTDFFAVKILRAIFALRVGFCFRVKQNTWGENDRADWVVEVSEEDVVVDVVRTLFARDI